MKPRKQTVLNRTSHRTLQLTKPTAINPRMEKSLISNVLTNPLLLVLLSCSVMGYAYANTTPSNSTVTTPSGTNTVTTQAHTTQPTEIELKIDELNRKIAHLEHQKDNLDKQSELLIKQVDVLKADVDNRFEKKIITVDKKLDTGWAVIILSLLGGVGGLITIFVRLKKYIEDQAKQLAAEKLEEEVSELIKVNKAQLTQLIEAHDLEAKLRKQKSILVITETENDQQHLIEFFENMAIKNVTYRVNEEYSKASGFDLVLFDDHRNTKNQHALFKEYIENSKSDDEVSNELVFLFYGNYFDYTKEPDYSKEQVNFSNSKFTLYNHIINSLQYQHLIQKDKGAWSN